MSRQIVLDTETTGLNARLGDRIIEIGCVELFNRRLTGKHFQCYVNPERAVEEGALRIHGLSDEFLADKPRFAEIANDFLEYIQGAELIIHNAAFDIEFINEELKRLNRGTTADFAANVIDSLLFARELHPGKKNSLNALCERYAIDNGHRTLHGALLDASLLAEVYLAMTRGQETLAIEIDEPAAGAVRERGNRLAGSLRILRATSEEADTHQSVLHAINKQAKHGSVWVPPEPAH